MSNNSVSVSGGKRVSPQTQDQQEKNNPLESNPLIKAVVSWITNNDFLAMKKIMAKLPSHGKTSEKPNEVSQGKSNVKLHPLLELVMENNNDVTHVDKNGRTILHHCLSEHMQEKFSYTDSGLKNDAALVKSMCEMGASVIAKDCNGYTPMGIALGNNRMDLVDAMVRFNSAEPTDCDNDGNTILQILLKQDTHCYRREDHNKRLFNAIDELISRGANLNQPNNEGLTPVHLAAKPLNCEVLKELVRRGADLKCRTSSGDDFLMLACQNVDISSDHLQTNLQWLLEQGLDVNSKNDAGFTPLHAATQRLNRSLVKALVTVGADVHAKTNDGANALHLSTDITYDYQMIRYYIEIGAAFNRRDIVHGIKLMYYLPEYTRNDENAVEWLIKYGFDRHEEGDLTLLHLVACYGYAGIVEELLERGVDVRARDDTYQYTPLHLASMRCRFKTVPELYKAGLRCVEFEGNFVCLSFPKITYSCHLEPGRYKVDHESTVLALLKAGADVNAKDRCGRTPLHYAARSEDANNLIVMLLRAGARLDELDSEGLSPLHSSLIYGNDHGLMRLLSFGADINDIEHPRRNICAEIRGLSSLSGSGVKTYLTKLKLAGLPVNDLYRPYLGIYQEYRVEYYGELEKLKNQMLTSTVRSTVSLYDWMRMNWKRRCVYIDDLPANVEDKFRQYGTVIQSLCNQAAQRKSLIESAKTAFQLLTAWQWPDVCVEHVLSFLNNRTLRVLIDTTVDC